MSATRTIEIDFCTIISHQPGPRGTIHVRLGWFGNIYSIVADQCAIFGSLWTPCTAETLFRHREQFREALAWSDRNGGFHYELRGPGIRRR